MLELVCVYALGWHGTQWTGSESRIGRPKIQQYTHLRPAFELPMHDGELRGYFILQTQFNNIHRRNNSERKH